MLKKKRQRPTKRDILSAHITYIFVIIVVYILLLPIGIITAKCVGLEIAILLYILVAIICYIGLVDALWFTPDNSIIF